jgi:hypothetical protein
MFRLAAVACVAALCVATSANATTWLPVTFNDLVTRADVIFVGDVVDVRPYTLNTREGTVIRTRVTFQISDPLFGTTGALEVLEFLGGEIGDAGMAVAGMPTFKVGDRRVVFASRGRSINPIVGFTQGLMQIRRDSGGIDRVLTLDGVALATTDSIGTERARVSVAPSAAMRLSDLRNRITSALVEARRR